jgi:transposase
MNTQLALVPPGTATSNTVVINARCTLRREDEQCVIVVGGLPVHHYRADDSVAQAYAMVLLVESGFSQQTEVARAFSIAERTVRRYQERYAQDGMVGLGREAGWRRGRRRVSAKRLRHVETLQAQGLSNRAIAQRLGVTEKAIRKLVGPSKREALEQLALVTPASTQSSASPSMTQPAAAVIETPADHSAHATTNLAELAAVVEEHTEDSEPVPMSLDRVASDRTFDRQLAYLGLLDDAAPIFRDGSQVPGVGVLLALPCLIESGLLSIARKLYGEIGPAFYGLRTTLLTLMLMALLRIQRPEHLKERDPAGFGRLLGLDRAPEVKTLRRQLSRLAAHHQANELGAQLARLRVTRRGHLMGFLYVDGHVRAYHGERAISRAFVARRHLAMPATTDYWVNDRAGDPLLLITGDINGALTTAFPNLLREVRAVLGERRATIVFDRGG